MTIYTLGIEGEFTLCRTFGVVAHHTTTVPFIEQMVAQDPKHYEQEFLASCIEVKTGIDSHPINAATSFSYLTAQLNKAARVHGLSLMGVSSHPGMRWRNEVAFENEHNDDVSSATPYEGMRYTTSGLHVHVGCVEFKDDPDAMVAVMQGMSYYLPMLLALTANSPFFDGTEPSGFASYRAANILVGEEPFGGVLPNFASYAEYEKCLKALEQVLPGVNINADIRINTKYQTIEVRVMDMISDKELMVDVVAIIQALVEKLHADYKAGVMDIQPRWVNQANRWNAAHYGMRAEKVLLKNGEVASMREAIDQMLDELTDYIGWRDMSHVAKRESPADAQLTYYNNLVNSGRTHAQAISGLAEMLVGETATAYIV